MTSGLLGENALSIIVIRLINQALITGRYLFSADATEDRGEKHVIWMDRFA